MNPPDRPYLVDKPLGATPLEALGCLRRALPELEGAKLAYAGRLDPMASGLLLVIGGQLLARQEEFWNLDKEYEAVVVMGITTDSYDMLGLAAAGEVPAVASSRIMAAAAGLVGKCNLQVPVFSSAIHRGKPLFAWAREHPDEMPPAPVRRMAVHEIQVCDVGTVESGMLLRSARERIPLVSGDFRQSAVLECWDQLLSPRSGVAWPVVRLRVACAGGTYIRSLAHEFGRRLGTGAFLAGLRRTRVAGWSVDDPAVIRLAWPQ